jgi:hypothetical protein
MALFRQQHTAQGSAAYSLIMKELSAEATRPQPSVSFVITILDAIHLCAASGYCNDKETIQGLLTLGTAASNLGRSARDSLAVGIEQDIPTFAHRYKFGPSMRDIYLIFSSMGCDMSKFPELQTVVSRIPIPPPLVIDKEVQMAAHDICLLMTPEQMANIVIEGFRAFHPPDGYVVPNSALEFLASHLMEDIEDPRMVLREAALFIVEQAIEKLLERAKFAPRNMQAEFVAMLIRTFDTTCEGFEAAQGPATLAAIRRAVENEPEMISFLFDWSAFEFCRNSRARYENLVCQICRQLATREPRPDDNPILDYVRDLPFVSDYIFRDLSRAAIDRVEQAANILNALKECVIQQRASQATFLPLLLELCVNPEGLISQSATGTVSTILYANEEFARQINGFAVLSLAQAVRPDATETAARLQFFFRILELHTPLLLDLLRCYGEADTALRARVRDLLAASIHEMKFSTEVLCQALDIAREQEFARPLVHQYTLLLSGNTKALPLEFPRILKEEFERSRETRYLIPIVYGLTAEEFKKFLPNLLGLPARPLQRFVQNFMAVAIPQSRPMPPRNFLIELHRFPETAECFDGAIRAMKVCYDEYYGYFTYQLSIAALDVVAREADYAPDLLLHTLLVMLDKFKESHKYILRSLVPLIIGKGATKSTKNWELLKQLFYLTKPASFKLIVSSTLPIAQIKDFADTYPDIRPLVVNQAKLSNKTQLVQALTGERE